MKNEIKTQVLCPFCNENLNYGGYSIADEIYHLYTCIKCNKRYYADKINLYEGAPKTYLKLRMT
jgi:hypothetical protein